MRETPCPNSDQLVLCEICKEWTTPCEPCCALSRITCEECAERAGCGELAPEFDAGVCHKCWDRKERHEYAVTVADANDWWKAKL